MKKKGNKKMPTPRHKLIHSPEEGHPSPKVATREVLFFSKTTDWSTIYRAWLPQRLSHKERQHAVQEDCEVRGLCRRSPRQQKWSGAPPHPLRGVARFRGPAPIPTSLFLSSPQCISYSQFNVKMFFFA